MRRAVAVALVALACAACPGRGSSGSAEPADVHIDWPDAAPLEAPLPVAPSPDAG